MRVSWQRSILDADVFLRKVIKACIGRPLILVDKGPWYPDALASLGLEWRHATFGLRNSVERLFRTFKGRTKRFYHNINARRQGILCVKLFLRLFLALLQPPENSSRPWKDACGMRLSCQYRGKNSGRPQLAKDRAHPLSFLELLVFEG